MKNDIQPSAAGVEDAVIVAPPDPVADAFIAGAYRRMNTVIFVLGGAGAVAALVAFGWRTAAGFLVGAALAYLNFLWLKQSIFALTDRVSGEETRPEGRGVVFKFLFRYAIIAAVGYVIISSSNISILSLIAGFFLSVVALLFEAVTELVFALRHGD